ncbi:hypothetical protein [uncultured Anaerovibrio sp.]|uniref:hypothetical protein n=1 Tax=uncultured Anaerovibrio sp. TaxID=361586 RepID=UPI0025D75904|nr:hypothetical protein [uncultured Anaerovibrio sp.]
MNSNETLFVSVKEFTKASGLTEYCVRRLLKIDEFPKLKYGHTIRIPLQAAQEWLLKRQGSSIEAEFPAFYG